MSITEVSSKESLFILIKSVLVIFNVLFSEPQFMSRLSSPQPPSDPCRGGIYSYSEQIELQK